MKKSLEWDQDGDGVIENSGSADQVSDTYSFISAILGYLTSVTVSYSHKTYDTWVMKGVRYAAYISLLTILFIIYLLYVVISVHIVEVYGE